MLTSGPSWHHPVVGGRSLLASLAGATLAACAGLPPHLADPRTHPDFPPSTHLTAVGRSRQSAKDAEADARRAIVERIRSEISTRSESVEREERDGDHVSSSASYLSAIRSEATFPHGELIRVEQGLGAEVGGTHHAFAHASVAELARVLGEDVEDAAVRFRGAVAAALDTDTLPAFTAAYRRAMAEHATLAARVLELATITGRSPRSTAEDVRRYRALLDAREQRLSSVRVAVTAALGDDPDGGRLQGLAARALSRLGLAAMGGTCTAGLSLTLTHRTSCERRSLCHHCALVLHVSFGPCGGAPQVEDELRDPAWRGASPRSETEALTAAWAAVEGEVLAARLRAALGVSLPLE